MHQLTRRSLADVVRRRADRLADDGFSLIELALALLVFSILASGFALTMGSTLKAFQYSRVKTLSEQLANEQLEMARGMDFANLIPGTTQTNPPNFGGYSFDVTTTVSLGLTDPAWPNEGADFKVVVVRVKSKTTAAAPVVMSTYVSRPLWSPTTGGVRVTVRDVAGPIPAWVALKSVTLVRPRDTTKNQTKTTDANGVVSFAELTPSSDATDYYYVTTPVPAAGYEIYPASKWDNAGSPNKFLVLAGMPSNRALIFFKPASVTVRLVDSAGNPVLDAATLQVTGTSGMNPTYPILGPQAVPRQPDGTFQFASIGGAGVIPQDSSGGYQYALAIEIPGCLMQTFYPPDFLNASYPSLTTYALTLQVLPCPPATRAITVNLTDNFTGYPISGADVRVNGILPNSSGSGQYTFSVDCRAPSYTIAVTSDTAGRAGKTQNIGTTCSDVSVPLPVPWIAMIVIPVQVLDKFGNPQAGSVSYSITDGPAKILSRSPLPIVVLDPQGMFTLSVPAGLLATDTYTIAVTASGSHSGSNSASPVLPVPPAVVSTVTIGLS